MNAEILIILLDVDVYFVKLQNNSFDSNGGVETPYPFYNTRWISEFSLAWDKLGTNIFWMPRYTI